MVDVFLPVDREHAGWAAVEEALGHKITEACQQHCPHCHDQKKIVDGRTSKGLFKVIPEWNNTKRIGQVGLFVSRIFALLV